MRRIYWTVRRVACLGVVLALFTPLAPAHAVDGPLRPMLAPSTGADHPRGGLLPAASAPMPAAGSDEPILVTTVDSDGPGSLLQAISDANADPDPDVIRFKLPGAGPYTITIPDTNKATISGPVVIDASDQLDSNGYPAVELTAAADVPVGLLLTPDAAGSRISGLSITGFGRGIEVQADDVEIDNVSIGVRPDGTAQPNRIGIDVSHADQVTIAYSRVVYNSDVGIRLTGGDGGRQDFVTVRNTVITATGGLGIGLLLTAEGPNGLRAVVSENLIEANGGPGISSGGPIGGPPLVEAYLDYNTITGNGTANRIPAAPGILLDRTVGRVSVNTIANNDGAGVEVRGGAAVEISGNALSGNGGIGIDLAADSRGPDGVTANDDLDADDGGNGLQNFPVLDSFTRIVENYWTGRLVGSLDSAPDTSYWVEIYGAQTCDPSGHGEGGVPLATIRVTTDAAGHAAIDETFAVGAVNLRSPVAPALLPRPAGPDNPPGVEVLTSTATGPDGTSEFSNCVTPVLPEPTTEDPVVVTTAVAVPEGTADAATVHVLAIEIENPNPEPVDISWSASPITADLGDGATDDAFVPAGSTTLQPGTNSVSVPVTIVADSAVEGDETFEIVWEPGGPPTVVTIIDDDEPPPAPDDEAAAAAALRAGWAAFVLQLADWFGRFDLTDDDTELPPWLIRSLATHFDLPLRGGQLPWAMPDPGADTVAALCADLRHRGFTVDFALGGACGAPMAADGDVLQVRVVVTLDDLLGGGDPLAADAGQGLLDGLASGVGLTSDGTWRGKLSMTIVIGVDAHGFYLAGGSGGTVLALDVDGSVGIDGSARIGGGSAELSGTVTADVEAELRPAQSRQRDLAAPTPVVTGQAAATVAVTSGPFDATWAMSVTVADGAVARGPQTVTGTVVIPGLVAEGGADAHLELTGVETALGWHLTADGAGANLGFLGLAVREVTLSADIGPDELAGTGHIGLGVPIPGSDAAVDLTVAFDRDAVTIDGDATVDTLALGDPVLLDLTDVRVSGQFRSALPDGPMTGSLGLSAASAILLPQDPLGTAHGVSATLGATGVLAAHADAIDLAVAGGALVAQATDVDLAIGGGPDLFCAAHASGSLPALGELDIDIEGLCVGVDGRVRADSVRVDSSGMLRTIGLGGILPFEVTGVEVVFQDPDDLTDFRVEVVGGFDFDLFDGLTDLRPRIGLGARVVTPDSPPAENRFSFAIDVSSLADGIIRPIDLGPLTVGFDGLRAGDYTLGADIHLGGISGGVFVPNIGGTLRLDGPDGSLLDALTVSLDGNYTAGEITLLDVTGSALLSGTVGGLSVTDLALEFGVRISFGADELTIEPRVEGTNIAVLDIPFGDYLTLRGENVSIDLAPAPGADMVTIPVRGPGGSTGRMTVLFDQAIPAFSGFGGSFAGIAIDSGFGVRLLPGFAIDITVPDGTSFGLPEFLPLSLDAVGVTFPNAMTDPDGIRVDSEMLEGLRLRLSGGLRATDLWPIAAAIDGLEIDLGAWAAGRFPVTNLDAVHLGVEPFEMPGGVRVGGILELGRVDVGGSQVFYGRVAGDLAIDGIGGGVELVVTEFGPVLMKVRAPLGIPLGPTGLVLSDATGAAAFGDHRIPVPPRGDPLALLSTLVLPSDSEMDPDAIRDAVGQSVAAGRYTWDSGFTLSITGELMSLAAPGLISGRVTLGMNVGFEGDAGLQLVGKGEVTTASIPLGLAGVLIDLADPLAPDVDLAFASPVPGSPLALLTDKAATLGVQIRTDGVALGTLSGLRTFARTLADGALGAAQDTFDAALADLAERLDSQRSRELAGILLDTDADGQVNATEGRRTITPQFVMDRLVGASGLPALIPDFMVGAIPGPVILRRIATGAKILVTELFTSVGTVMHSTAQSASAILQPVALLLTDATTAGLSAFGDRFDPSVTIVGGLQPMVLGLPMGSPSVSAHLSLDRQGLYLQADGSVIELWKEVLGSVFPPASGAIKTAVAATLLGVSDRLTFGARLPFGGVIDAFLGSERLPTFDPLDPEWALVVSGSLEVIGMETAEVTGIAFLPEQPRFLDSQVQKLWTMPPGTDIDPDLIPITSQEHYDRMLEYGGILMTASLRAPRILTRPQSVLQALPDPPDDPARLGEWLAAVAATTGSVDTPARIQFFLPGITTVHATEQAMTWAKASYLEGVWDGTMFGLDLGRGTVELESGHLTMHQESELLGVSTTVTIAQRDLGRGRLLPTALLERDVELSQVARLLTRLGLGDMFSVPPGASSRLRAATPGVDPDSDDPVLRSGGIEMSTTLDLLGLATGLESAVLIVPTVPPTALVRTSAARVGPLAGVTITDAVFEAAVDNGRPHLRFDGEASFLDAPMSVHGDLGPTLTGTVQMTSSSGRPMRMLGLTITGTVTMNLTRAGALPVADIRLVGEAELVDWLARMAGKGAAAVVGCVSSAGAIDLRLAVSELTFGPRGLVHLGSGGALPDGGAGCALPPGPTGAAGPQLRFSMSQGVGSVAVAGALRFDRGQVFSAGASATGWLDARTGAGELTVSSGGRMSLAGGFAINGSAVASVGPGAFALAVTGTMTVADVLVGAQVTGSGDESGISRLTVATDSLRLPPLTVTDSSITLERSSSGGYVLQAVADVTLAGSVQMAVSGTLDANGSGTLAVAGRTHRIGAVAVTDADFLLERSPATTRMSVSGQILVLGSGLRLHQSWLSLSSAGISGNALLSTVGGSAVNVGDWVVGGEFGIAFTPSSATITLRDGRLTVPSLGTIHVPTFSFGYDASFTRQVTVAGWSIGPALTVSPMTVTLTFGKPATLSLQLVGTATAQVLHSTLAVSVTALSASSTGSLSGRVSGSLAPFGVPMAKSTYSISRVGGVVRLTSASNATVDAGLGYLVAKVSGWADAAGRFSFTGRAGVAGGVTGFSLSGSAAVSVASATGVTGSFSGTVCIVMCVRGSATMRDAILSGVLRADIDGNGRYEVNASWSVNLRNWAVRVDINRDGDYEDLGDIVIGTFPPGSGGTPSMSQPPDLHIAALLLPGWTVPVYFDLPLAYDGSVQLTVSCIPASGSRFGVGSTTVTCQATNAAGRTRSRSFTVTVAAEPFAVPDPVTPGGSTQLVGGGFQPGSLVQITVHSRPVSLGVFRADRHGVVTATVRIPVDITSGGHTAVLQGFAPDGSIRQVVVPVIVGACGFGYGCDAVAVRVESTHVSRGDGDRLSMTGAPVADHLGAAGILILIGITLCLLAGSGHLRRARRPS